MCGVIKNNDMYILITLKLSLFSGKGKKDDDWSDEANNDELEEKSEDDVPKPISKKKCKHN